MLYICIFSNKFDLNQAICVSHKNYIVSVNSEGPTVKLDSYSITNSQIEFCIILNRWR